MSIAGIQWNFLFHDHKTIDPFSHLFDQFKNSQLFQISGFPYGKLPVDELGPMQGACLMWVLHLVWTGTCKVHWETSQFQWKHQCRHQGLSLLSMVTHCVSSILMLGFLESVHLTVILVPSFPQWTDEPTCNFAFSEVVSVHVWLPLLDFLGTCWNFLSIPQSNKAWLHGGCNNHPLKAS